MKKTILTLAIIVFMAGTISTSFGREPDKKSEKAREDLKEAKKDLKEAQKDSVTEYQKFKKETEVKIASYDKSIADFKVKIAKQKKVNKAKYEKNLAVLEQKNSDLKKKLADYKEEGQDKWISFKKEFNHDMNELGKSLKDFTVKNT
jgi:uncharacterized protein (DUF3084 family)